jgi:RNA polymerase sigma factor (sigma-70 family)
MDDFAEFFGARQAIALRALLVATGGRAAAEDAVAEAFARAYQRWSKVREHPNPTAWVIRTALNVSRSSWRRRRREWLTGEQPEPAPVDAVATGADGIGGDLETAVAALPRRQREVLALRVLADLSAEDTGVLLGISAATVHVHHHRALDTLRAGLRNPDEITGQKSGTR